MDSIVLGASGIVGRHIVDQLVKVGKRPIAVSRTRQVVPHVTWLEADLAVPNSLLWPSASTIYCTANVALLADALPHLVTPSLQRVVAFTSTSIITKLDSELKVERDSAQQWADAERRLIEACASFGVAWTVLRPTIIYDEGHDANITRLARLIERIGFIPLAGSGAGLRQPVHAQDLAIGAMAAASSPTAANMIYATPGTDTVSYREMVGRIFDGLQRPRRMIPVPRLLWRAAFTLARPFISDANVAMGSRMTKDMTFDPGPAVRDFGWNPREFRPHFLRQA